MSSQAPYVFDLAREKMLVSEKFEELVATVTGSSVSRMTISRWRSRGLLAKDGTRVRLPFIRVGKRRLSSWRAFCWFVAALGEYDNLIQKLLETEAEPETAGATAQ